MTLHTRALVLSTFFGSCIAIGLLLVSLTTNNWVNAYPRRSTSNESTGEVNYGLFYGTKQFNTGFGFRHHPVTLLAFMQEQPNVMSFWLWLFTALGTGCALLSCAVAAIVAVLKAASDVKKQGVMVMLLASNIFSAGSQIFAFIAWLVQFYQHLTHNVLAVEDHQLNWSSRGRAYLGYSFYLLIASTLIVIFNIIIILHVKNREKRKRRKPSELTVEENKLGLIMLY